ncbi:DUF551 domain-containing protein [Salmonella enterica subsp. salamae]|nr:DUF551 domain-containing protein [Salmonella enterica subsp. salamae]
MSNIDKQALREVAERATQGPWEMEQENIWFTDEDGYTKHLAYVEQGDDVDDKQDHYNTAYIAAANPATMLALLDENIQLQREKDAIEAVALALRDDMRQARIALASLDAEPVAWTSEGALAEVYCGETGVIGPKYIVGDIPLYRHAQPVPVVPEEITADGIIGMHECGFVEGWNACRAAMLHGGENSKSLHAVKAAPVLNYSVKNIELLHADCRGKSDGNSPVIPDGWISCSERMPDREYVLAGDFSGTHYLASIPNVQVGIYADWFDDEKPCWDDGDGNDLHLKEVTHWMPLPEPPQEVK